MTTIPEEAVGIDPRHDTTMDLCRKLLAGSGTPENVVRLARLRGLPYERFKHLRREIDDPAIFAAMQRGFLKGQSSDDRRSTPDDSVMATKNEAEPRGDSDNRAYVAEPQHRERLMTILTTIREYHLVDDVVPYCFALAVAVSNVLDDNPLWGMLVGPPSGGKTESLHLVDDVVAERLDSMTAASLLSWKEVRLPKGGKKEVPVGILTRIKDRGFVTISDFSTILTGGGQRGGIRDDLFSLLRRVYDGRVQRDLGNVDRPLVWEGRVTFLAACTGAIDNYSSHSDALGPRWLYLRLKPRGGAARKEVTRRALTTSAGTTNEKRALARSRAGGLIEAAQAKAKTTQISVAVMKQVEDAALVASLGRASVPRDSYGAREVIGLPEVEETPRIAKQLRTLAQCLIALGLSTQETGAIVSRAATDSMPEVRAKVLDAAVLAEAPISSAEVARAVGCAWKVAERVLEDFEVLGVVKRDDLNNASKWSAAVPRAASAKPWILDGEDADIIRAVFARQKVLILSKTPGQA
jgi:hypothetical protein